MQKINLREVSYDDGLDCLEVLKELANEENMNQLIAPKGINEELYKYWLDAVIKDSYEVKTSLRKYKLACTTYWVTLDEKVIGLADIKHYLNYENSKVGGHIGIALLKDYRNKGIGYNTMKLLIEKTGKEFNISKILITTQEDNIPMRRVLEKLGGIMTEIDEECHYWLTYSKNQ